MWPLSTRTKKRFNSGTGTSFGTFVLVQLTILCILSFGFQYWLLVPPLKPELCESVWICQLGGLRWERTGRPNLLDRADLLWPGWSEPSTATWYIDESNRIVL